MTPIRSTISSNRASASTVMLGAVAITTASLASSHREAPFITEIPKVDGTDFYMFNSYEPGREGYVTIVANYVPLQDAYGGPNYFALDPDARYEIHIDNDGDAREDITFTFRIKNTLRDLQLDIGGQMVSVPLINIGAIAPGNTSALNVIESYTMNVRYGEHGQSLPIMNATAGGTKFLKPVDNIGNKSIPDYPAYAAAHVFDFAVPGFGENGRVFVGQRKDSFVVNLGETFDLVNTNPLGPVDGEADDLADKNVTSFIIEVPAACLRSGDEPVIGGWTTASLQKVRLLKPSPSFNMPTKEEGPWVQVSRLGMPLVNEVVIGLKDKNKFNNSRPKNDGQFALYVTNPTLPALLNVLFGVTPPCLPRTDLVAAFLTGVPGLNQPADVVASEMLRLNTTTPVTPAGQQNNLGVIGGDAAGFPNGRRPGDDVIDITLRVAMGVLLPVDCAPSGQLPFTDGAFVDDGFFDDSFPYLRTPIAGSPN